MLPIDVSGASYTLHYDLTEDEAIRMTVMQMRAARNFRVVLAAAAVGLVLGAVLAIRGDDGGYFLAAAAASYLVFVYQAPHRAIRRVAQTPGVFGPRTLWLLDEGVAIEMEYSWSVHRWTGISGVSERPHLVVFMRGRTPLFSIPMRVFGAENSLEELERLVAERARYGRAGAVSPSAE